jgi:hypothetical protein
MQLNYDLWQARKQKLPKVKLFPHMGKSA